MKKVILLICLLFIPFIVKAEVTDYSLDETYGNILFTLDNTESVKNIRIDILDINNNIFYTNYMTFENDVIGYPISNFCLSYYPMSLCDDGSYLVKFDFYDVDYNTSYGSFTIGIQTENGTYTEIENDIDITVEFDTDGGTAIADQQGKFGDSLTTPKNPTKEGYSFLYWCEQEEGDCYKIDIYGARYLKNTTYKAVYVKSDKIIKKANVYVKSPLVGDEITIDYISNDFGSYPEQNINPTVIALDDGIEISYPHYYDEGGLFEGTIAANTDYYISFNLDLSADYIEASYSFVESDLELIVNGTKTNPEDIICMEGENHTLISCNIIVKVKSTDQKYGIISGANQTIKKGSELTVRADGELDNLKEIKVDNKVVPTDKYKLTKGSTIVTLDKSYIETLSNGEHTLTFVYNDGEVETKFNIEKEEKNPNTVDYSVIAYAVTIISAIILMYFIITKKRYN